MAIQMIEQRKRIMIEGTIRLGIRKENEKFPREVDYFVFKDAPKVASVYGENCRELDIMFPVDDLDRVIPTAFQWWASGKKGADGQNLPGKLKCSGNGPDLNGTPGNAEYWEKRDPVTGVVPCRECRAQDCPDWVSASGDPQCKPTMRMFFLLPRVNMVDIYLMSTTSWHSIKNIYDALNQTKQMLGGRIALLPFKLSRRETPISFTDKDGKEKRRSHFILYLNTNFEEFYLLHGNTLRQKVEMLRSNATMLQLPAPEDVYHAPIDDHYPTDPETVDASSVAIDPAKRAEEVVTDPEVVALFAELEATANKTFSLQQRVLSARSKENEPDMKAAVVATLREKIATARASKKEPTPVAQTQPPAPEPQPEAAQAPSAPKGDDGGII